MIYALAKVDFGNVYFEDGAADGTVTEERPFSKYNPEPKGFALVKAVVDLKATAIPLLIEHLDDARPTRTLFNGKPVPLGHIALDILTNIVGLNREVIDTDNTDDGLGAGIQIGFYFRPDASLAEMKRVKENWRRLYRRGKISFSYPLMWPDHSE